MDRAEKIVSGRHRAYPSFVPEAARRLMDGMFAVDPARRITIDAIKRDPWFAVGYTAQALPACKGLDSGAIPLAQRSATTLRLTGAKLSIMESVARILSRVADGVSIERSGDKACLASWR
jgi:hypothetical protein